MFLKDQTIIEVISHILYLYTNINANTLIDLVDTLTQHYSQNSKTRQVLLTLADFYIQKTGLNKYIFHIKKDIRSIAKYRFWNVYNITLFKFSDWIAKIPISCEKKQENLKCMLMSLARTIAILSTIINNHLYDPDKLVLKLNWILELLMKAATQLSIIIYIESSKSNIILLQRYLSRCVKRFFINKCGFDISVVNTKNTLL